MKFFAVAALMATTAAVRLSATNAVAQGPPSWEDVLEVLDSDNSGTVSWGEIMDFVKEMEKQHGEKMPEEMKKELKKMFDYVDKDGSGDIDKAEFEAAIKAHGAMGQETRQGFSQLLAQQPGPPTWEEVLEVLDKDGSGTVSWGEIEGFIKQLEKEHGVKISKEDKKMIRDVFQMVDTDGSGDIDKAEFEAAVKAHGGLGQKTRKAFNMLAQQPGPPTWEEVLEVLDKDGSGTVSWGEIEGFIKQLEEEHGVKISKEDKKMIRDVFQYVDKDGSGDIDKAEFEAAMAAHGAMGQKNRKAFTILAQQPGPPTWEEVLEVLDSDASGTVSWEEIMDFVKEMEKQHGQKMPEEMKKELRKAFDYVDKDGSGDIDKAEFEAAIKAHGAMAQETRKQFSNLLAQQPGPPTWEEVLEVLDKDGSGTVSWGEIEGFIKQLEKEHGVKISKEDKKMIRDVFQMVDTDGSGDIDKAEFEAAMAAHGAMGQKNRKAFRLLAQSKQGPPTWEEVLEVLDKDGSGTVSWGEIVSFIKQLEKEHGIKISKEDKKMIRDAFEMVDADGSGDIDKAEFEAALKAMEGLATLKKYM